MRRCLVVLCCLLGVVTHASAQEFDTPTLRGSSPFIPATPQYMRWGGFYAGAQIGRSSTDMDFSGSTKSLIAQMLRTLALENEGHVSDWVLMGKSSTAGVSYGGFVGYNTQWSDVIVGLDFHYNGSNFFSNAPSDPMSRLVTAGGNVYSVTAEGAASMRVTDYGVMRGRAGWIVGNFLPYATLGVAVGRADISRSAHVYGQQNPATPCGPPNVNSCVPFDFSTSTVKNGQFVYGWAAGLGVDVMVMPNVFMRAEFEYMGFTETQGIKLDIGTMRVGAGYKF